MVDRENIIKQICQYFSFYKKDKNYFETVIPPDIKNIKDAYKIVLDNLKNDWVNLNMAWFLNELKNSKKTLLSKLSYLINTLKKYDLVIDINYLSQLLQKYHELDDLIFSLFKNGAKVTYEYLAKLIDDDETVNFLILYATIKEIYVDEEIEDDINLNTNNKSFYSDDSLRMYLLEIKNYPMLSHEKIIELFEKIADITNRLNENITEEEKKTLERKYNFYRDSIINANLRLVVKSLY